MIRIGGVLYRVEIKHGKVFFYMVNSTPTMGGWWWALTEISFKANFPDYLPTYPTTQESQIWQYLTESL